MNTNVTDWALSTWRSIFTHEIGHVLGIGDIDLAGGAAAGNYWDDQAVSTTGHLTNSFASLIDPLDPEGSAGIAKRTFDASLFDSDANDAPYLLMESNGDGLAPTPAALDNDTFAARQFLYPVAVPEPGAYLYLALVACVAGCVNFLRRGANYLAT